MILSPHFSIAEFCRKNAPVPLEYLSNVLELARRLEVIRAAFDRPIQILSGYRSPEHNARVKGAEYSQHLTASAADIRIESISVAELSGAIERAIKAGDIPDGGLGQYHTRPGRTLGWVHLDIRAKRARWQG